MKHNNRYEVNYNILDYNAERIIAFVKQYLTAPNPHAIRTAVRKTYDNVEILSVKEITS